MEIITVYNDKGGTGKTTITKNLARELCRRGHKVLLTGFNLLSNDEYDIAFEYDGKPTIENLLSNGMSLYKIPGEQFIRKSSHARVDFIPCNKERRYFEAQIVAAIQMGNPYLIRDIFSDLAFQKYDYILLDCGKLMDTFVQYLLTGSDYVIVPAVCEAYSFDGIDSTVVLIEEVKTTTNPKLEFLGVLINRFQPKLRIQQVVMERLLNEYGEKIFETVLNNLPGQCEFVAFDIAGDTIRFRQQCSFLADEVLARIRFSKGER